MSRYSDLVKADSPLIYLPLDAEFGVLDQSGNGRDGTGAGGVAVGTATGPGELKATDFDGVDDRVTTSYATRRNLMPNPSVEASPLAGFVDGSQAPGAVTLTRDTGTFDFGSASLKAVTAGGGSSEGPRSDPSINVTASLTYTFSVYVNAPNGATLELSISERDAADAQVGATQTNFTGTGAWQRISVTRAFGATGVKCRVFVRTRVSAQAITFYADGWMLEQAAAADTYFDGSTGPDTAWEGTANSSVSSKGVFANGSVRTFEGWANRDTSTSADILIGGDYSANDSHPLLRLESGSQDVRWWFTGASGGMRWTAAWPGNGQWVHWMLVADEPADLARLYINGSFVSSQSDANAYTANTPNNFETGARKGTNVADPFDGKIAHVAVYNGDKSSIAGVHYNAGLYQLVRGTGPAPWYSAA